MCVKENDSVEDDNERPLIDRVREYLGPDVCGKFDRQRNLKMWEYLRQRMLRSGMGRENAKV